MLINTVIFFIMELLYLGITPVYVRVGVVWTALVDEALGGGEILLAVLDGGLELKHLEYDSKCEK